MPIKSIEAKTAGNVGHNRYVIEEIKGQLSLNRERFYEAIEKIILPKIKNEIQDIIKKGWADAISPNDLYHCHLLIGWNYNVDNLGFEKLISCDDIQLLYHSKEFPSIGQNTENRNILSTSKLPPRALQPKIRERNRVDPADLRCWDSCCIYFGVSKTSTA